MLAEGAKTVEIVQQLRKVGFWITVGSRRAENGTTSHQNRLKATKQSEKGTKWSQKRA